jgi:hypothetical protein
MHTPTHIGISQRRAPQMIVVIFDFCFPFHIVGAHRDAFNNCLEQFLMRATLIVFAESVDQGCPDVLLACVLTAE